MSNEKLMETLGKIFTEKYGVAIESASYEIETCEFCNSPYQCRVHMTVDGSNRTGRSCACNSEGEAIISAFEEAIQPKYTLGGLTNAVL
jgi:hypothetical protein